MRRSSISRRAWRPPFRCRLRVRSEGPLAIGRGIGMALRVFRRPDQYVRRRAAGGVPRVRRGVVPVRTQADAAGAGGHGQGRAGVRSPSGMPQLQRRSNLAMTPWIRGRAVAAAASRRLPVAGPVIGPVVNALAGKQGSTRRALTAGVAAGAATSAITEPPIEAAQEYSAGTRAADVRPGIHRG